MILEGLVTTVDVEGRPHLAPMGPRVDMEMHRFELRPFQTSTTFANLIRSREGVLHVIDDVLLLAQAAVGRPDPWPELDPAPGIQGWIIRNCCRWYAFRVTSIDAQQPRAIFQAEVVAGGSKRDFFGFNRGKHAVVEAAILATRTHLLSPSEIDAEFARLEVLVGKTGGPQERLAFDFLSDYVRRTRAESLLAARPEGSA